MDGQGAVVVALARRKKQKHTHDYGPLSLLIYNNRPAPPPPPAAAAAAASQPLSQPIVPMDVDQEEDPGKTVLAFEVIPSEVQSTPWSTMVNEFMKHAQHTIHMSYITLTHPLIIPTSHTHYPHITYPSFPRHYTSSPHITTHQHDTSHTTPPLHPQYTPYTSAGGTRKSPMPSWSTQLPHAGGIRFPKRHGQPRPCY